MAIIHQLIQQHGRDQARQILDRDDRHLVDVAASVLSVEKEDLGFAYTGWAFCGLPHRNQDKKGDLWQRDVGPVTLTVTAGHLPGQNKRELIKYGVPYGIYGRLVLLHMQSEAVRTGMREIDMGRSFGAFLDRLGIAKGGETRKLVWDQVMRVAACQIMFTWQNADNDKAVFTKTSIVQSGELSHRMFDTSSNNQLSLWKERVVLDRAFFENIQTSVVPLLEQAVRAIGSNSVALDVYVWLAYRLRKLENPVPISWAALNAQFGSYARTVDFKRNFIPHLRLALAAYPDAHVSIEDDGVILYPSCAPIGLT